MRVRAVDHNGDMQFGGNQANYLINSPDAVGQIAGSRLALWLGQWFLDTSQGMPWATKVLGKYTGDTRDAAIQAQILGTPGVLKIASYASQLDRETREFTWQATLSTIYGAATIQGVQA